MAKTVALKEMNSQRTKGIIHDAAFSYLPDGTDADLADYINKRALADGWAYTVDADKVAALRKSRLKKAAAAGGETPTRRTASRAVSDAPTLDDVEAVREAVAGSAATWMDDIARVEDLANKVGGLAKLRRCLEFLVKMGAN